MAQTLVEFNNITLLSPHGSSLLENISFKIYQGLVYGLIGANGSGKSILLSYINREVDNLASGRIDFLPNLAIAALHQEDAVDFEQAATLADYLLEDLHKINKEIEQTEEKMASVSESQLPQLLDSYQKQLDIRSRYEEIQYSSLVNNQLKQAGLAEKLLLPMSFLSGGERRMAALIKTLNKQPDLLLLDEPETFLDLHNLIALEQILSNIKTTALVVSHNRHLLDTCCNRILLIENKRIIEYKGNYTVFKLQQLSEKTAQQRHAVLDQRQIDEQESIAERFAQIAAVNSNPGWGKRLRARRKLIEHMASKANDAPYIEQHSKKLIFKPSLNTSGFLLKAQNYSKSFSNSIFLLKNISFSLNYGQKAALWGGNGVGKSSLLKDLANGALGFAIDGGAKILYLKQFDGLKKNSSLSAGQNRWRMLQGLGRQESDLIILDEPSTNLDIFAQEALEDALLQYNGALLLVTHDFYLLDHVVDTVFALENGFLHEYSLEEFKEKIRKSIYGLAATEEIEALEERQKALELQVEHALQNQAYHDSRALIIQLIDVVMAIQAVKTKFFTV